MLITTPVLISWLFQNVGSGYSLLPANRAAESQPFSQLLYKNSTYNHRVLLQKRRNSGTGAVYTSNDKRNNAIPL